MLLPFTNKGLLLDLSRLKNELFLSPILPEFSLPVTDRRPCSISEVEMRRGVGVAEFLLEGGCMLGLVFSTNFPVLMYCM